MRLRLLVVVLLVVLVGALPPGRVLAQGCVLYTPVFETYYYLPFATVHPGQEAAPWWRTGNYNGYKVVLYDSLGGTGSIPTVILYRMDAVGAFIALHTFSTPGDVYTIAVTTSAISMSATTPFTGYVCASLPPTPTLTPIPPTATLTPSSTAIPSTPTLTPIPSTVTLTPSSTAIPPTVTGTVVLFTATPVLTATPNPQEVLVERANQSLEFNIFIGSSLLGLVVLIFFLRR